MKRVSRVNNRPFHPETLMMGYGYDPFLSEGAVKPPVFLTSTFAFRKAEEGKQFFEWAYGLRQRDPEKDPEMGLIYSRLNNPDLEILEDRLATWENAEKALVFSSGMSAITTGIMSLVKPGQEIISTNPVYGGTDFFFEQICPAWNIKVHRVTACSDSPARIKKLLDERKGKIAMVYIETPSNPTNQMVDIKGVSELCKQNSSEENDIVLVVDNTFLGPTFQKVLHLGADIAIYSATKFIGGHSDLVAGAMMGKAELLQSIAVTRTIFGSMSDPFSCWLMMRSLETVSVRMDRQQRNALAIVDLLKEHPTVDRVFYPGEMQDAEQERIWREQCTGSGSLISFEIKGGEKEAFKILNSFEVCKLAVSLGGTESLVQHPSTMTHSDLDENTKIEAGITDSMIRLSVGIENEFDLLADVKQALDSI
jgi:methionine-gamma-lyase